MELIQAPKGTVSKNWWQTIEAFVNEQREIERGVATRQHRTWTREDEKRILMLGVDLRKLLDLSRNDPEQKPKCDPKFAKFYKHKVTQKLWRLQIYVWPDGKVELRHNQVADSIRHIR